MGLIGVISVHKCDGCGKHVSLHTDAQYHTFAATWHEGWDVDFCELCRETDGAKIRIADDRAKHAAVDAAIKKYGIPEKEAATYVN